MKHILLDALCAWYHPELPETWVSWLAEQFNQTGTRSSWEEWLVSNTEPYISDNEAQYIIEKRVVIRWANRFGEIQQRLLPKDWHQQWFQEDGQFKDDLRHITDGRRIVIPIDDPSTTAESDKIIAYLKAHPPCPGIQCQVDVLSELLLGYYLPANVACLIDLKSQQPHAVQLSQAMGKTLQEHAREGTLAQVCANIDPYYFTLKVLLTLLIYPEDDKADNIVVREVIDIDGTLRTLLISIDNDSAFVDAFEGHDKSINILLKSMVLCFDQMTAELDPTAVAVFQQLDPYLFLKTWLDRLSIQADCWSSYGYDAQKVIFYTDILQQLARADEQTIPAVCFEMGVMRDLYTRMRRLQAVLGDSDQAPRDHFDLMGRVEPVLTAIYHKAYDENTSILDRFKSLPTDYVQKTEHLPNQADLVYHQSTYANRQRAWKSLLGTRQRQGFISAYNEQAAIGIQNAMAELHGIHCHYQQINIHLNSAYQLDFNTIINETFPDFVLEEITNRLDFKTVLARDNSYRPVDDFIQSLVNRSFLDLNFTNLTILENDKLLAILRSCPNLRSLTLTGCTQLTGHDLVYQILKTCRYLVALDVSRTSILSINPRSRLGTLDTANLTTLKANDCQQLEGVFIRSEKLTLLELNDCPNLNKLKLTTPNITLSERLIESMAGIASVNGLSTDQLNTLSIENLIKIGAISTLKARIRPHVNSRDLISRCIQLAKEYHQTDCMTYLHSLLESFVIDDDSDIDQERIFDRYSYKAPNKYTFRIVTLGNKHVGRRRLLERIKVGDYLAYESYRCHKKVSWKEVMVNDTVCRLILYNISSKDIETKSDMALKWFKSSIIVVIAIDITNQESLKEVQRWIDAAQLHGALPFGVGPPPLVFIATKCDLVNAREVSRQDMIKLAKANSAPLYQTSAETGEGINEFLQGISQLCLKTVDKICRFSNWIESGQQLITTTESHNELHYIDEDSEQGSDPSNTKEYLAKMIWVGETAVGKTTLLKKIKNGKFFSNLSATIGVDFFLWEKPIDDALCRLQIWDVSGYPAQRNHHGTFARVRFRSSVAAAVAIDITLRASYENALVWLELIRLYALLPSGNASVPVIFIATKCDLEERRCVTREEISSLADYYNAPVYETSAKTGAGIDALIEGAARLCLRTYGYKSDTSASISSQESMNENNVEQSQQPFITDQTGSSPTVTIIQSSSIFRANNGSEGGDASSAVEEQSRNSSSADSSQTLAETASPNLI